MEVSSKKCFKPLRDVEVDYEIDNEKCKHCEKPCLNSCPVDAIFIDGNGSTNISERCIGCVLCRESCPYDAIKMHTKLSEPIRENIPNINPKLCKACGACVSTCKSGAIHLAASGSDEVHSEIDEGKCVRCGYCFRLCPTDAIKYGEILPKTVSGGKAIVVNQDKCIGCMTCTRICPSKGAINVGNVSKLPYIDPSYCARCEECMDVCPSTAIKYSSRKRAFEQFSKIKSLEIASEIIDKDTNKLSINIVRVDSILSKLSKKLSDANDDEEFEILVTDTIKNEIDLITGDDLSIVEIKDVVDYSPPIRKINVFENKCIGCGACIDICPTNSIKLENPSPIHINNDCVFCGQCVSTCSFSAIAIKEEYFENKDNNIYFVRENVNGIRKGSIDISNYLCQSCGVCVNRCPVDALAINNDVLHINMDLCIFCRECESICPLNAINFI
jgi:energy-converting hydrogenase A subunit Q